MVKSIDVALTLINESIKRGKTDPSYYMDYIKLHKLMYLGECMVRNKYGFDLFGEQVLALDTGPYVEGLDIITAACGFEEIKDVEKLKKYTLVDFPIPALRKECCDLILDVFGKYNTEEIVKFTKNTLAYRTSYIQNQSNIINKELMAITGEDLFIKENIDRLNQTIKPTQEQVLEDNQQVMVRLSWCRAIYAKLVRNGLINDEYKELFDIVSKAIDSVNFYPSGERIKYRAPSLHVDVYGSMSVGDIKKIFSVFGTLLFGCHIKDDYSGYIDVIPTEKEQYTLVRKPIHSYKK